MKDLHEDSSAPLSAVSNSSDGVKESLDKDKKDFNFEAVMNSGPLGVVEE